MSHVPRHATAYTVEVGAEEDARRLAALLAERGHTAVRVASSASGNEAFDRAMGIRWRVSSLDEGPYPTDDEYWWMTVEERVVTALADGFGAAIACGQAGAETARRLLVRGEVVAERTVEEVAESRLAVLSREPARARPPVIVHGLGSTDVSGGPGGGPVPLDGLDSVDWASLSHAYGQAGDVPDLLRRLAANGEDWDDAMREYFGVVVHQGTCYEATPPTIGFLVQIACAPQLASDRRSRLLAHLAHLATLEPAADGDEEASYEARTSRAVAAHLPELLGPWPDASPAHRAWLVVLAALDPPAISARVPELLEFRRRVEGPSPALDLALAMITGADDAVLDRTLEAAAWDEEVPRLLELAEGLRSRHLRVLVHLALAEFADG
ncbi:SPOR domain-containing protein [Actinomadura fibrosa]|uniref:SPOR domain-containing protein n=1 Tax=Actinomadura fibrosa TaxID=111802 RepID=A0ABW2Y167_9ACTN|nr:SPOR domain-containing protein [Actinomadura fibrosa]